MGQNKALKKEKKKNKFPTIKVGLNKLFFAPIKFPLKQTLLERYYTSNPQYLSLNQYQSVPDSTQTKFYQFYVTNVKPILK